MDSRAQEFLAHRMNVAERMSSLMTLSRPQKVNNAVPVVRYYRSMIEAHRMALCYIKNQDIERALILLIRFCSFTIEELPKHVDYNKFDGEERKTVLALLKPALEKAEVLKKQVKTKFELEAEEAKKMWDHQMDLMEAQKARNDHVITRPGSFSVGPSTNNVDIVDPGVTTSGISFPNAAFASSNEVRSSPQSSTFPSAPPVNRADKPNLSIHAGNRTLLIAGDLVKKFLKCAEENTAKNVETCGTLCGSIMDRDFVVSHVILPKQTGASDGCSAEGEEDIFAYQNEHDLITLGWIHTHPSQTAFLSSVDLHTHCAYQMMLSEAVAIVCAPSHNQVGTFVLTSYGMSVVESCTKAGFHVHPEKEKLFVEADHVKYTSSHSTTMVDLRK